MITTDSNLFKSLRRRYRTQKSLRSGIEKTWDEIDYYTGPIRWEGAQAGQTSAGGANMESRKDIWDFTAIEGRERLAATIQVGAMNPVLRWIQLSWRKADLNRDTECQGWLSDRAEEAWGDVQDSDFNTEIGSFLLEWCGPGHAFIGMEPMPPSIVEERDEKTGRIKMKEEWSGADFTSIPLSEGYFEQDRRGGIRTFWRRHSWSPAQVIDFCEDNKIDVPEDIAQAHEKGEDKVIEVVCAFYIRPEIAKRARVQYPAAPDRRPWGALWWREDKGEILGDEKGYYEQPIFMCRYSKTAGSKWGHGPSHIALPTVKYVNATMEMSRAAGERAIDPPILTDERNITSTADFTPGGVTLCRDPSRTIVLESKARFDVAKDEVAEDRAMIRKIFHTDDLELKDSPAMTATEAQIRYEWMQRLLGKSLTALQNDALGPMILNLILMRVRLGASPPIPKKAKQAGGVFNVEYQGPLARSMRTDEVAAIERGATFVAGLSQFYPKARAAFDPIKAIKHVFTRLGVPADVIPSEAEMKAAIQGIEQAEQRAISADSSQKEAKAKRDNAEAQVRAGALPQQPLVYPGLPPIPPLAPSGAVA